jgi:hypothetical protein
MVHGKIHASLIVRSRSTALGLTALSPADSGKGTPLFRASRFDGENERCLSLLPLGTLRCLAMLISIKNEYGIAA